MTEITFCSTCDNVHNPKDPYYRWNCIKFPRLDGHGFVTEEIRETDPYMRCSGINGGSCPLYTPKREGK